jgi:hypothetical protein
MEKSESWVRRESSLRLRIKSKGKISSQSMVMIFWSFLGLGSIGRISYGFWKLFPRIDKSDIKLIFRLISIWFMCKDKKDKLVNEWGEMTHWRRRNGKNVFRP